MEDRTTWILKCICPATAFGHWHGPSAIVCHPTLSFASSSEGRWGEMLGFLQYRILKHGDVVWQTSIGSSSVFKLEVPLRSRRYNSCAPTDFHELPWFKTHGSSKKRLFAKQQTVFASSAKNCKMVRSTSVMVASFDCARNVALGRGGTSVRRQYCDLPLRSYNISWPDRL